MKLEDPRPYLLMSHPHPIDELLADICERADVYRYGIDKDKRTLESLTRFSENIRNIQIFLHRMESIMSNEDATNEWILHEVRHAFSIYKKNLGSVEKPVLGTKD